MGGVGRNTIKLFFSFIIFIMNDHAFATEEFCWEEAGERYSVDPLLLYSIAQVESNLNPKAFNDNGDTQDYGIMQINSWWLDRLSDYDIDIDKLYHPCININIGAWILNHSFGLYGYNWEAVGAYNAGTSKSPKIAARRMYYASKVQKQYDANRQSRNTKFVSLTNDK